MAKRKKNPAFSAETIKRLSLYLRNLKVLQERDINVFSSGQISRFLTISPDQFRKDLSYFGGFGKPGVGYPVADLIREIERILGLNRVWKIVLVGAGKLGGALLGFPGFSGLNMRIVAAFDDVPQKAGALQYRIPIHHIRGLEACIKREKIKIAMICTPPEAAQEISDRLVKAGVKAIVNFAPIHLKARKGVFISNIDMACELESLIYFIKTQR